MPLLRILLYKHASTHEQKKKNTLLFEFNMKARWLFSQSFCLFLLGKIIVSLCDAVLLVNVNAFDDTNMLRTFSVHSSESRCQSDSKPPRNRKLRYFYRILHHMHTPKVNFFLSIHICCRVCFFLFILYLGVLLLFLVINSKTLTRNTMESSRVYANIGVCLNSFVSVGNFQLCLKLD